MKQFIKALNRDRICFRYLCSTFLGMSMEKKRLKQKFKWSADQVACERLLVCQPYSRTGISCLDRTCAGYQKLVMELQSEELCSAYQQHTQQL